MSAISYKFVSYADWESNYKALYPFARANQDLTEVVISCLDDSGDTTKEEALEYIAANWPEPYLSD